MTNDVDKFALQFHGASGEILGRFLFGLVKIL